MVMEEAGFKYVINMTGGISNWEKDGLPVVQ
jgi:rhodanese-related sulfurtransferase